MNNIIQRIAILVCTKIKHNKKYHKPQNQLEKLRKDVEACETRTYVAQDTTTNEQVFNTKIVAPANFNCTFTLSPEFLNTLGFLNTLRRKKERKKYNCLVCSWK